MPLVYKRQQSEESTGLEDAQDRECFKKMDSLWPQIWTLTITHCQDTLFSEPEHVPKIDLCVDVLFSLVCVIK